MITAISMEINIMLGHGDWTGLKSLGELSADAFCWFERRGCEREQLVVGIKVTVGWAS